MKEMIGLLIESFLFWLLRRGKKRKIKVLTWHSESWHLEFMKLFSIFHKVLKFGV